MNLCFISDWEVFYVGLIFCIISAIITIWLIPKLTIRLIKNRNKKYLSIKTGAILQEFCEFIFKSPFRDDELHSKSISVFTPQKDIKNYRFVALCTINVFDEAVYPKMTLVIYDFFKNKNPDESYSAISKECDRLKSFRLEIEKILAAHSLHIDDDLTQKISCLCMDIKSLEIKYAFNLEYDDLLKETNSKRGGIFGVNELFKIYENLLVLTKELISLDFFEYEIDTKNKS